MPASSPSQADIRGTAPGSRELGAAGMADRSCRPHHCPRQTTCCATTAARSWHTWTATGQPVRRYERDRPGELIHVDVKKLGNIPEAAAIASRAESRQPRPAPGQPRQQPRPGIRLPAHCPGRPHPPRPHRDPARRAQGHRRRVLDPSPRLVRRRRHHHRTRHQRQRFLLPLLRLDRHIGIRSKSWQSANPQRQHIASAWSRTTANTSDQLRSDPIVSTQRNLHHYHILVGRPTFPGIPSSGSGQPPQPPPLLSLLGPLVAHLPEPST